MSATKLWYPHYIEKYRRKTGHLTLAEHGAYRLLMDWYWDRRGPLPANEDRLRRFLRADAREWRKIREAVLSFFVLTEEGYRHETIDEIMAESDRQYEAKRERIAVAREAKRLKHSSDYRDESKTDRSTPSPSPSHIANAIPVRAGARGSVLKGVLKEGGGGRPRETQALVLPAPDDPETLEKWEALRRAFGDHSVRSWFVTTDGRPAIHKNGAGWVIEASPAREYQIQAFYSPQLNEIFGGPDWKKTGKGWRIEREDTQKLKAEFSGRM